jgi:hypothetical protein
MSWTREPAAPGTTMISSMLALINFSVILPRWMSDRSSTAMWLCKPMCQAYILLTDSSLTDTVSLLCGVVLELMTGSHPLFCCSSGATTRRRRRRRLCRRSCLHQGSFEPAICSAVVLVVALWMNRCRKLEADRTTVLMFIVSEHDCTFYIYVKKMETSVR